MDVSRIPQVPGQRGGSLGESAVRYVEEWHWDVAPGAWLETGTGRERCSCGATDCPSPGGHPDLDQEDWEAQATGSAVGARRLWAETPDAAILLPTGRTFDTLDVPESAGFLALARMERMGIDLGPVSCTPDRRMHFFVLPGAAPKVPDLIRKHGWMPATLDVQAHGDGDYTLAPPTRVGTRGAVHWVRRPTVANRWLPDAAELVSALAYACGRARTPSGH
ncbi:bifunctional DNA primase/polymerase [Streptomyces palmae]|uniref:Bifunctional DNA primase/polymerase n=1 Tax=Streptomyces palmae TaxID=1701085 RepID=A0A4Z0FNG0_9ACTN|nr:bifunctional DNA primase/polymerase [Streptomyces palmae]TGA83177.1 bifunctional DNA primase/polymerase [Streptomyces palmae]